MNETERIAGGNKVMEVLFFKLSHKIIILDTQRASPVTMILWKLFSKNSYKKDI